MHRFDSLTQLLSSRTSRRSTVLGTSAAVVSAATLGAFHASAQNATPVETPAASPVPTDIEKVPFLFVQSASSATFAENTDANDTADYLLTMKGHTGGTVYFSDRPERIFGEAPTQKFLDGLGFDPANPPNAAIVTSSADGSGDVLVVELTSPTYDAGTGELSYGASILESYTGDGLAFAVSQQQDPILAPELGSTSLFIDDCPNANPLTCYDDNCNSVGNLGERGMCWKWDDVECVPCSGGWDGTAAECNAAFPACNGKCITDFADDCTPPF